MANQVVAIRYLLGLALGVADAIRPPILVPVGSVPEGSAFVKMAATLIEAKAVPLLVAAMDFVCEYLIVCLACKSDADLPEEGHEEEYLH